MATYEPLPRVGHISGCVDKKHIVQGGVTRNFSESIKQRLSSVVDVFDTSLEEWTQEEVGGDIPKPGTYNAPSASSPDGCIYSFGGLYGTQFFNTLYKLHYKSKTWTLLSPQNAVGAPMPKYGCGVAILGDSIVVVNGHGIPREPTPPGSFVVNFKFSDGRGWTDELHVYDVSNEVWSCPTSSGERPPPCADFTFTAVDERRAVMFGGYSIEQGRMNNVYIFDISTMNWRRLNKSGLWPWPEKRHVHAACCLNYGQKFPQLLMTGGMGERDKPVLGAWILDVERERWRKVDDTQKGRWGHSLTALSLAPGLTEVMQFGGSGDPSTITYSKIADTTLMQFRPVESSGDTQWELLDIGDKQTIGFKERVVKKAHSMNHEYWQHSPKLEEQHQRTRECEGEVDKEGEKMRKWEVEMKTAVEEQERLKDMVLKVEEERDNAEKRVVEMEKERERERERERALKKEKEKRKVEEETEETNMANKKLERMVRELVKEKKEMECNHMLATNAALEREKKMKKELNEIKEKARKREEKKDMDIEQLKNTIRERDAESKDRDTYFKALEYKHQALLINTEHLKQKIQQQEKKFNIERIQANNKIKSLENELNGEREKYKRAEIAAEEATKIQYLQSQIVALQQRLQQAQIVSETTQSRSETVIESKMREGDVERYRAEEKVVKGEEEQKRIAVREKGTQTDEPKKAKDDKVEQPPQEDHSVKEKNWATAEKMVIITNEEQDIEWKGYGLKLCIPQNSLPEDVSRSQLQITVSRTEDYQLPTESGILVSAIYSFKHDIEDKHLRQPIILQIQHCASTASFTLLCLALSNEVSPPFQFRAIESRVLDYTNGYCSFELDHFGTFAIYLQWFLVSLLKPRAVMYYTNVQPSSFEFLLYVVPGLDAILKEIKKDVRKNYEPYYERGPSTDIEYCPNETLIHLKLSETPVDGWSFKHLGFETMLIEDIVRMRSVLIPFQVKVKWSEGKGESIKTLEYDVKISGTEGGGLTVISPRECTDGSKKTGSEQKLLNWKRESVVEKVVEGERGKEEEEREKEQDKMEKGFMDNILVEKVVQVNKVDEQSFELEGYGLKVHVHKMLQHEEKNHFQLRMAVLTTKNYQLPTDNGVLISAIYQLDHDLGNRKLSRSITLQMQHCLTDVSHADLSIVWSDDRVPPYHFRSIPGGKFNEIPGYSLVTVDHFCIFSVLYEIYDQITSFFNPYSNVKFIACVYYTHIKPGYFKFCLFIVQHLEATIEEIRYWMEMKNGNGKFTDGTTSIIEIGEVIELHLPEDTVSGWTMKHDNHKKMKRSRILVYKPDIPFEVTVKWNGPEGQQPQKLEYMLPIENVEIKIESPDECTIVETVTRSTTGSCGTAVPQDFSAFPEPTSISQLMKVIGVDLKARWKDVGRGLKLEEHTLDEIEADNTKIRERMSKVFTEWKNQAASEYSWWNLAEVISSKTVGTPALLHTMLDRLESECNDS